MPFSNGLPKNRFLSSLYKGYEDYEHVGQSYGVKAKPIETGFSSEVDKKRHLKEVVHDPYRSRVELNQHPRKPYNPDVYIKFSKEELDRQAAQALETMKQNSDYHEENIKANQWRGND